MGSRSLVINHSLAFVCRDFAFAAYPLAVIGVIKLDDAIYRLQPMI
jgi:hypothetical protein